MRVICEKCGHEHDVKSSRIPEKGARLKCQQCGNIMFVRPEGSESAPMTSAPVSDPVAPPEPSTEIQAPEEPIWKIRNIGITFSFHDLDSLCEWLSNRTSLDGVQIAKGKDDFKELGDYPEVLTTELITRFFPLGDVPTSKNKKTSSADTVEKGLKSMPSMNAIPPVGMTNDLSISPAESKKNARMAQKARERAKAEKQNQRKKLIILAVVAVLLVVAVIAVLRFTAAPQQTPAPAPAPVPVAEPQPETPPTPPANQEEAAPAVVDNDAPAMPTQEEIENLAELELQKQLSEAEDMVNAKKWPEARTTLEQLLSDMPEHPEVLEMLSKTYRGLDLHDKAAEMDARLKAIRKRSKE